MRIATGCIILNNNRDSLIVLMNNEQKFELTTSVKTRFLLDFFIHLFVYLFSPILAVSRRALAQLHMIALPYLKKPK